MFGLVIDAGATQSGASKSQTRWAKRSDTPRQSCVGLDDAWTPLPPWPFPGFPGPGPKAEAPHDSRAQAFVFFRPVHSATMLLLSTRLTLLALVALAGVAPHCPQTRADGDATELGDTSSLRNAVASSLRGEAQANADTPTQFTCKSGGHMDTYKSLKCWPQGIRYGIPQNDCRDTCKAAFANGPCAYFHMTTFRGACGPNWEGYECYCLPCYTMQGFTYPDTCPPGKDDFLASNTVGTCADFWYTTPNWGSTDKQARCAYWCQTMGCPAGGTAHAPEGLRSWWVCDCLT